MSSYPYDYYEVLGFKRVSPSSGDGIAAPLIYERDSKQYPVAAITTSDIKKAYRQKALHSHSDKEQDLEKKRAKDDAFGPLTAAYQFLSTDNDRAAFNEWLEKNPEFFAKKQSLILYTKTLAQEAGADEKEQKQAVDLSHLYHQTPCPGLLKETAKGNPDFARSLLEGSALRNELGLEDFYTILLDLFEKQPDKDFISKALYDKWLSTSRLSDARYGSGLQMACLHYPNKAVLEPFITLFSAEFKTLGLKSLLLLVPDFFSAEEIIFQAYSPRLSLAQIEYLFASGKKESQEKRRTYYYALPKAQRDKCHAAWDIKDLIAKSQLQDNKKLKDLFAALGPNILELGSEYLLDQVEPDEKTAPPNAEEKLERKPRTSLAELFVLRHLSAQQGPLTAYLARFPHSAYREEPADFIAELLKKLISLESKAGLFSWLMQDEDNLPYIFETDAPLNAESLLKVLDGILTETQYEGLRETIFKQLLKYAPAISFFTEALLGSDKPNQKRVLPICKANSELGKAVMAHPLFKESAGSEQPAPSAVALIAAYFSFHHLLADENFETLMKGEEAEANGELKLQEEQDPGLLQILAAGREEIVAAMSQTKGLVVQKPLDREKLSNVFWESLQGKTSSYAFDGEQLFWVRKISYKVKWSPPLAISSQELGENGLKLPLPQSTAQPFKLCPEQLKALRKKIASAEAECARSIGLSVETIRQVDAQQMQDKEDTEEKPPISSGLYSYIIKEENSADIPSCPAEIFADVYKQLKFLPWMVLVKLTIEASAHRFLLFQHALQITGPVLSESLSQEEEILKSCEHTSGSINLFLAKVAIRFKSKPFLTGLRASFLGDVLLTDDASLLRDFDTFLIKSPESAEILRELFMQKLGELAPEQQQHWLAQYEKKLPLWSQIFIPGSCLTFPCAKKTAYEKLLAYLEIFAADPQQVPPSQDAQQPDQPQLLALLEQAGADKPTLALIAAKLQNFPAAAYAFFLALTKTPFAPPCEEPIAKLEQQFLADLESKAEKPGMLEIALLYIERHSETLAADPSLLYKLSAQFGAALDTQLAACGLKQQADSATLMAGFFAEVVQGAAVSLAEPQENKGENILQEITAFIASQPPLAALTADKGLQEKQWYKRMLLIDQQQAPEIGALLRASSGGTRSFYHILLIMATYNQSAWAQGHLQGIFAKLTAPEDAFRLDLSLIPFSLDEECIRYLVAQLIPPQAWPLFFASFSQSLPLELSVKLLSELDKKCQGLNREIFTQIILKLQVEQSETYYGYAWQSFLAQKPRPSLKEFISSFRGNQDSSKLGFLRGLLAYTDKSGIDLADFDIEIYALLVTGMPESAGNLEAKADEPYRAWAKQQERALWAQLVEQRRINCSFLKQAFVNQPVIAFILDNIADDHACWQLAQLMLPPSHVMQGKPRWIFDYLWRRFEAKRELRSRCLYPLLWQEVERESNQQPLSPDASSLLSELKQNFNTESFDVYTQGMRAAIGYLRTEDSAAETELGSLNQLKALLHSLRFIFYRSGQIESLNNAAIEAAAGIKIKQLMLPILQQAAQTPALLNDSLAFKQYVRNKLKQSLTNELLALSQAKEINRHQDDIYVMRAVAVFGFILSLPLLGLPLFSDAYRRVFFYSFHYNWIAQELDKLAPEPKQPWKWLWRLLGVGLIGGGLIASVFFLGVWPVLLSLGLGPVVTGFLLAVGSLMTGIAVLAALELALLPGVSFNKRQIKQQLLVFASCLSGAALAPFLALVVWGVANPLFLSLLLGGGALGAVIFLFLLSSAIKYTKGFRPTIPELFPCAADSLSEEQQPLLAPQARSSSAATSDAFHGRGSTYVRLPTTEPLQGSHTHKIAKPKLRVNLNLSKHLF